MSMQKNAISFNTSMRLYESLNSIQSNRIGSLYKKILPLWRSPCTSRWNPSVIRSLIRLAWAFKKSLLQCTEFLMIAAYSFPRWVADSFRIDWISLNAAFACLIWNGSCTTFAPAWNEAISCASDRILDSFTCFFFNNLSMRLDNIIRFILTV